MVGAAIIRCARIERRGYELKQFGVGLVGQNRPLGAVALQALVEPADRGVEPNGGSGGVHFIHIVEKAGGAAATGNDNVGEVAHLAQHGLLHAAEAVFASGGEQLGYGCVEALLDVVVQVNEVQAGGYRQGAAER